MSSINDDMILSVWNQALATIGHDRNVTSIDPAEDKSVEATRCRSFYDAARRAVLAARPWQWVITEEAISADSTTDDGRTKRFTRPDDMVRFISARSEDGTPRIASVFGSHIISDAEELIIRYVRDLTTLIDWPPLLLDTLVSELGARLAIPIVGNFEMSNALRQLALRLIEQAAEQYADEAEEHQRPERRRRRPAQTGDTA